MAKHILKAALVAVALGFAGSASAQTNTLPFEVHGNFQLDAQYYLKDSLIGAPEVPESILSNGFGNIVVSRDKFSAGLRYESYLNPMLGFDSRYKGSGITYRYATYTADELEVTLGNFYDQFGSGLIFRSYEERNLGIDNAMDGLRVKYNPHPGVYLKGIIGEQRFFFDKGPGIVRGVDGEVSLSEAIQSWAEHKTRITIGASAVSKYQKAEDPIYKIPNNVLAWSARTTLNRGGWRVYGEYAFKSNDPSLENASLAFPSGIYKNGYGAYFNATYTKKGLGLSVSAKHIDNMSFRSDRSATGNVLAVNYLPALTKQQTYRLATLYPYASQAKGEAAFQTELFYNFKKGSVLGGANGTYISVNYSKSANLDTTGTNNGLGYSTNVADTWSNLFTDFAASRYFEEVSFEMQKKVNKDLKVILNYIYTVYDQNLTGEGKDTVTAHTAIAEFQYKISKTHSIRTELQHLYTLSDRGNWALGLVEYSISPNWFFAFFDEYNYGNEDSSKRIHYWNGSMGYTRGANRVALAYGKQRQGLLCVGGVCRNVPASNGFSISITSSF
ncbi:MAG: DUF6029 family protein [Bacteroidota bacterium]|jgi:hypothetical protein